jgi:ubiquinone/menaquinone biosynthesis C-methylase UbiE/uncharacterized protein YbaR (Trm112 family)
LNVEDILVCPECRGHLTSIEGPVAEVPEAFRSPSALSCDSCERRYPIVDDIHVLWSDELRAALCSASTTTPGAVVKAANAQIYNEVSAEYDTHYRSAENYQRVLARLAMLVSRIVGSSTPAPVYVDVGCGTSTGLPVEQRLLPLRIGVDISLENLRLIKRTGANAVLADGERLPFSDGSIGLVSCLAALHHLPKPDVFFEEARRILSSEGIVLTAGDPSSDFLSMRAPARAVWALRKPVYRLLARFRPGYHFHSDSVQVLNDLAEVHRTDGGFTGDALETMARAAGFGDVRIFHEDDYDQTHRWGNPGWKLGVLQLLSGRNPFRRSTWCSLSVVARGSAKGASAGLTS